MGIEINWGTLNDPLGSERRRRRYKGDDKIIEATCSIRFLFALIRTFAFLPFASVPAVPQENARHFIKKYR